MDENASRHHELPVRDGALRPAPDRTFGFVMSVACVVLLFVRRNRSAEEGPAWIVASAVFALLAVVRPRWLRPLNLVWTAAGSAMGRLTSPLLLAVLYLVVVTPTALFRRAGGRDPLGLRFLPGARTYWSERPRNEQSDMTRQF